VSFGSPWLLLFLLAVPLAIWGSVLLERQRARRAESWSAPALVPNMVPASPGRRRYIPLVLFLLGLILLLAGFARPQATINVPREGATVVLALDVSGSMEAKDVKPTRLLAARAAALQFVKDLPDKYRVSLVTFSDHGTVRVQPTYDRDQIERALPLKAQAEGTALASGVATAVKVAQAVIGEGEPGAAHPPAAVLLLSDGSQTVGQADPADAAAKARKLGIPISTVSLGTPRGVVVRKIPGVPGGEEVTRVPPAPAELRDLAGITGGTFFQARSSEQLKQVYKDLGSRLVTDKKKREITVALAGVAVVFLVAGAALSGVWFRRLV
jgi:Ca-activated chloride channel homolog